MLTFDADTAQTLETAYHGADLTKRRRASFDLLDPAPRERILDLGCGNGMLTVEIARAIGSEGEVTGLDLSEEMMSAARTKCEGMGQARFLEGSALDIPFLDDCFDKAVSLQVFEYIEDVPAALAEVARVLRPGGRFVIADLHFGSWLWHADDRDRMDRMIASWDSHCAHRDLPEHLPRLLRDAGFRVERVVPVTLVDTVLKPDGYGAIVLPLMSRFAVENGHVSEDDVAAWQDEQRRLAEEGRFFFSITQYAIAAQLPG